MKKILLLLTTLPLLLLSCTKEPIADFTVSTKVTGIGETVFFTNRSMDAESFVWDFGDGVSSNAFNASHYYDYDGVYSVSLTAIRKGHRDIALLNITVIDASIEITVEEYYEPFYLVPDISVILYPSLNDWENFTNPVEERFTNSNGIVRFDHLGNQRYYVDVWGPYHKNWDLATEDVGWIETPVLIPGTLTYFTAVVDYYPDGAGDYPSGKKSSLNRFGIKAERNIAKPGHQPRLKIER